MRSTPQGLAPQSNLPDILAERLASVDSVLPDFEVEAFGVPIDSAEATPGDWTRIAAQLVHRWNDYDAFVVLHGTDTMAYTASALSFMLRDLSKPIILTGSQNSACPEKVRRPRQRRGRAALCELRAAAGSRNRFRPQALPGKQNDENLDTTLCRF